MRSLVVSEEVPGLDWSCPRILALVPPRKSKGSVGVFPALAPQARPLPSPSSQIRNSLKSKGRCVSTAIQKHTDTAYLHEGQI